MLSSFRMWLAILALIGGALFVACGGDDEGDSDGREEPTATEEVTETPQEETPTAERATPSEGGGAGGEDTFEDVPVPEGAEQTGSGSLSASDIPSFVPSEKIDPGAYSSIEFRQYNVAASVESVIQFYQDKLVGWDFLDAGLQYTGGLEPSGAFGVWTRDDGGTALWIGATDTDGTTELIVILGTKG